MFCNKCGGNLPDDAKFCAQCGNVIERQSDSADDSAAGGENTLNGDRQPVQQPAQQQMQQPAPQPAQQAAPGYQPNNARQYRPNQQNFYPPVYRRTNKGCIIAAIIVIVIVAAAAVLLIAGGGIIDFNFNFSTAKITDLNTSTGINEQTSEPVDISSTFAPDSPVIYVTGIIRNAPQGTEIQAIWVHVDSNSSLDGPVLQIEGSRWFSFALTKDVQDFPIGDYKVKILLDGKQVNTADFQVVSQ